jgi:hypothetical protein
MKYVYKLGILCRSCKDKIYSESAHDYVECKCGKTFVDGGNDYLRYGGNPARVCKKRIATNKD